MADPLAPAEKVRPIKAVQRCPNCEARTDVSFYVAGAFVRCSRCGVRFEVQRQTARQALNRVYDRFVAAYGPINKTTLSTTMDGTTIRRMPNLVTFCDDPDAWAAPAFAGSSCCGVATAIANGMISSKRPAKISSVVRQPNTWIRYTPSGENRNCPNEPDAVPSPKENDRQLSGRSLPNDEMMRLNEHPERPKPISTPLDK